MGRYILPLLFLILVPYLLFGDQFRFEDKYKSENGNYILKLNSPPDSLYINEEWVLIDSISNNVLYEIKDNLSYKSAFISDDGRKIIAINDWPIGRPENDLLVLSFYINGKVTKSYFLDELLKSIKNTSASVSHFSWFFYSSLQIKEWKTLTLKTFELSTLTFDLSNGKKTGIESDPRLDKDTYFITGKLKRIKKGLWKIEISHSVLNNISENTVLEFEVENDDYKREKLPDGGILLKGKLQHNQYYTILVKNGKFVDKIDVIFNYVEPQNPNENIENKKI